MNTRTSHTPTARPTMTAPTVVAGLVPHGDPHDVARAAVAEAARRGCRVTFVQVLPAGLDPADRADADDLTFHAAVEALRGRGRVAFSFETADGDAAEVLLDRCRGALALVVGEDVAGATVAQDCARRAACDVVVVPRRAATGGRTAALPG